MKSEQNFHRLFGFYIKQFREKRGYTIDELVNKANVDRRTIERIESGKSNALNTTVCKLVVALDMDNIFHIYKEIHQHLNDSSK